MTRIHAALLAASLAALAAPATAQTKMKVQPESKVTVSGGSNVHDWSCSTNDLRATIEVEQGFESKPLGELAQPVSRVAVAIPVKSLKCGKGKMDENLYKALRADAYPEITYVMTSLTVDMAATSGDKLAATVVGDLTVAGTTARVEMPLTADRQPGGKARGEGSLALKMTDVGVKPPTALMGTMRTKNEITISFVVLLDKDAVVALTQ